MVPASRSTERDDRRPKWQEIDSPAFVSEHLSLVCYKYPLTAAAPEHSNASYLNGALQDKLITEQSSREEEGYNN